MTTMPDQMPELVNRKESTRRQKIACFFGHHDWCARVELGAKPDAERVNNDTINYFFEFAAPVCRHCPKQLIPRTP